MDTYRLHYSPLFNLFMVINDTTGITHSSWADRRDATNCLKDLARMKKEFEKNIALNMMTKSGVKSTKGITVL